MEIYNYRYLGKAYPEPEVGHVGFELEGERSQRFTAILSVADAEQLADDLSEQIRAARKQG